jgi:hypothetical protein
LVEVEERRRSVWVLLEKEEKGGKLRLKCLKERSALLRVEFILLSDVLKLMLALDEAVAG